MTDSTERRHNGETARQELQSAFVRSLDNIFNRLTALEGADAKRVRQIDAIQNDQPPLFQCASYHKLSTEVYDGYSNGKPVVMCRECFGKYEHLRPETASTIRACVYCGALVDGGGWFHPGCEKEARALCTTGKPPEPELDLFNTCIFCGAKVKEGERCGCGESRQHRACVLCGVEITPANTFVIRNINDSIRCVCTDCAKWFMGHTAPTPRQVLAEKVLHEILRYHTPNTDAEATYFNNAECLRNLVVELKKSKELEDSILVPTLDRIATLLVQAAVEEAE